MKQKTAKATHTQRQWLPGTESRDRDQRRRDRDKEDRKGELRARQAAILQVRQPGARQQKINRCWKPCLQGGK